MSDLRFEPTMTRDDRPARAIYEEVLANPARKGFGFGQRAAVVNIDVQQAYTRPDLFPKSAYVTDPDQIDWINRLSDAARIKGLPVVWTRVCYKPDGGDAGDVQPPVRADAAMHIVGQQAGHTGPLAVRSNG